jgi:hypothetical protein
MTLKFKCSALTLGSMAASLLGVGSASAQSTTSVDVGAGAGYSRNPFLVDDDETGSMFGRVFASLTHRGLGERTKTTFSAYVENTTYGHRYGSSQLADLNAQVQHRASEKVDLFGDLRFTVDEGGQLLSRSSDTPSVPSALAPTISTGGPGSPSTGGIPILLQPLPGDVFDPAFFGLQRRQYSISGRAGGTVDVSSRDMVTISAGIQNIFFGGNQDDQSYVTFSVSGVFDHRTNERASFGVGVEVRRVNYSGDDQASIFNPTVHGRLSLSESLTVSASAGVTITDQRRSGERDRSTGLSLDGSVCNTGETSTFCGRVARYALPSTGGALFTTTSFGFDFVKHLSISDTIKVSGNLYRYSGHDALLSSLRTTFAAADLNYSRKLSDRLSAGVTVSVRSLDRRQANIPTDFVGSAFVRYRIGDPQ